MIPAYVRRCTTMYVALRTRDTFHPAHLASQTCPAVIRMARGFIDARLVKMCRGKALLKFLRCIADMGRLHRVIRRYGFENTA